MKASVGVAAVVIIVAVAGTAFLLVRPGTITPPTPGEAENEGGYRIFNMTAKQFEFEPSTISVN